MLSPRQNCDDASAADAEVLAAAMRKVINHQELNKAERAALKRHERRCSWSTFGWRPDISRQCWKEERLRRKFYKSIPQKAARYGIPFGGPTVDLFAVARALHDFLADHAQKLARDDDALMQGSGSPALERYREERALIARLERLERETKLLPRDDVRDALQRIASILRGAGDTLERQFGHAAAEILHEALDDAQREVQRTFGEVKTEPQFDPPTPA